MVYDIKAFAEAYRSEDLTQLGALNLFDGLRLKQWEATNERADKEKDPASKHKMKAQLYGDIMQSGSYFAGVEKLGSKLGELGLGAEESLGLAVNVGASLVDKILKE